MLKLDLLGLEVLFLLTLRQRYPLNVSIRFLVTLIFSFENMVQINYMDSKKKIIFLKIYVMKNILLYLLMLSTFSFSQVNEFQGFMDFTYNNDSGKIILNIEELDKFSHDAFLQSAKRDQNKCSV